MVFQVDKGPGSVSSRSLTLAALLIALCGNVVVAQQKATKPTNLAELKQQREEAARRKRRMIFNNDGDDVIYTKKEPTAEALLALRTTPLVGSQVDSIFYSNSLCFGHSLHDSKVMEPFTCTEAMFSDNGLPQLMARGIDPIQVMAEFSRKHNVEIFWDMRMNDTHDSMIGGYGPYLRPKFKLDHPEYLVGARDRPPKCGTWTSVDYAQPEVRDLAFRFFGEVCQTFEIDGVEMDFFRHACFFKSVAQGGVASRKELDSMTGLLRRIREMTEREGLRRGRPILIAIRVPDSVEYCQGIGLDVEKWLAEGLVDLLIGTGYFRLNRWEYLVELGHRYGVPVYPCLSESRIGTDTRFRRNSIESYRARAMRAWAAGADGIYLFNYFDPRGAVWRELGDPEALSTMDKLYFVTVRDGSPDRYLAGGSQHRHVPILTPDNPFPIMADEPTEVELVVGDDLSRPQQEGRQAKVTCHVQTTGAGDVTATLNGKTLDDPTVAGDWLDFPVPPQWLKKGVNRFGLLARPDPTRTEKEPNWTVEYTGATMPSPPWSKMGFSGNCVAEVRDGSLFIADRGTDGGDYAFFRYPCFIDPSDETIIEVRMKPVSGWSSVLIENGISSEEIQFYPDRVEARNCRLSHTMDTTDAFHTYRISIEEDDFKVCVDGELRIDGAGKLTRPAYNGRSGIAFGAANSPSLGEACWESVKIYNRARSLNDLVLSIQFKAADD
ncbi:MAG TPA: hypothetical protein VMY37_29560 [Thermoguttaceae bacterium]|nr:hypothetical protein [Thermoguttaceae bacterium]